LGLKKRIIDFKLPREGVLEHNGPDDPLKYYYKPLIGGLYRARFKQALSLLEPPYGAILEIGYGSGILMPTLASIGSNVSGIDLVSNPESVRENLAKIGVVVSLKKADARTLDYPDESFDLIIAISVIEHLDDVKGLLRQVYALLRPGGHFLVGMPKVGGFMNAAFRMIGYRGIERHHLTDYHEFIEASGGLFKVMHFTGIPSWAHPSMALYFNILLVKN
jgi:SAM-dependent methyltransferase